MSGPKYPLFDILPDAEERLMEYKPRPLIVDSPMDFSAEYAAMNAQSEKNMRVLILPPELLKTLTEPMGPCGWGPKGCGMQCAGCPPPAGTNVQAPHLAIIQDVTGSFVVYPTCGPEALAYCTTFEAAEAARRLLLT